MPVDFTPVLLFVVMIVAPGLLLFAKRWLLAILLLVGEIGLTSAYVYQCLHPPVALLQPAEAGNARAAFELARWYTARNCFGQGAGDFDASWRWLKRSAGAGYPPAIYTMGVLYRIGDFLPQSPERGETDAPHKDVAKGQALIDKAASLGFVCDVPDEDYYKTIFCIPGRPIPFEKGQ